MKKLILGMILLFGVLGFSRYVEECKVIEDDTCISLESGKRFNFSNYVFEDISYGSVYKVYFEGNGYRNLYFTGATYLYNLYD
nr:hypothetical protein [uncultured Leptotrichia sp.]